MLALLLALAAAPPLPPFPTEVRPRDATTAPANAALFALGDPAPSSSTVGIAVAIDGVPAAADIENVGCCVIRARFDGPPAQGDVVSVTLTSPSGDASWTWTAGADDVTAPTFTAAPSLVDHGVRGSVYSVVAGVEVADDTQLGMITATLDDASEIVGVTVDGFVLSADLPVDLSAGEHCLTLIAVDVAENDSAPETLCFDVAPPGEGEGEGDPPPSGCASTTTASSLPWVLSLALLALLLKRSRGLSPAVSALLFLAATPAMASGVTWVDGSLDDVIQRAKSEKKLVFVEVWATWCSPCKKQAAEVFDTDDGATLTKGMIAWRVDFDEPAQRSLMERWNVLSLPTILIVRPDGSEVDRIEGYDTKDAFLVEARAIAKGSDPLPALEKKLAKSPSDAQLTLEVAHRKLVRGDADGARMLEKLVIDDNGEPAQDALFLLGRYHSRVKRDFAVAKHVWRELYTRFPAGKFASTAAWWYAGALFETKDAPAAFAFLEKRARTFDANALEALIDFAVERKSGHDVAKRVLDDAAKAKVDVTALRAKLDAPAKS